mmetsp:Transcript_11134/g.35324  ORF Transcript_11134/g.35324 Transcript_11134/m.35324 type:complete len:313 (+) Transcript_11134:1183-2121(+)
MPDRCAVPAALRALRLLHELHGPGLGRSADRHCPSVAEEGVDGVELGPQVALHVVHRVDQPTVELDLPPADDLHRAVLADPRLVVAVDVGAHGDLRLLLGVRQDRADVLGVLQGVLAAPDGAADGAGLHAHALQVLLGPHEHLRRGADEELVLAQVDEEAVGRGVALLQAVEDLAGARGAGLAEGLGEHGLEEVAARKLLLCPVHELRKLPLLELPAADARGQLLAGFEGHLRPASLDALRVADALGAREDEVVAHPPRALLLVVDDQELVREVEHEVALIRVAVLVELDLLELEGKVVPESAIEAQVLVLV